jgi:hypothetical protein
METTFDIKSRLGYLAEFATAAYLSQLLEKNGYLLHDRASSSVLTSFYETKREEVKRAAEEANRYDKKEFDRQDSAGIEISKQILQDIFTEKSNLACDIELTGDSAKGESKADLVLLVYENNNVLDTVAASIKAYKSPTINLANTSYVSLFKSLFYDGDSPNSISEFIDDFVSKYGSREDLNKLYKLQTMIKDLMETGVSKDKARSEAKKTHPEVIETIINIFNEHYQNHKKEVNNRMLKLIGFDGSDDFYAAIGKHGKQKVLSSRKNKELQQMLTKLSNGFDIVIQRNGLTNNAIVNFNDAEGNIIISGTMTFADSGGSSASGKVNYFINFKQFL